MSRVYFIIYVNRGQGKYTVFRKTPAYIFVCISQTGKPTSVHRKTPQTHKQMFLNVTHR